MESVKQIRRFIEEEEPGLIAVELDQRRLYALLHNVKNKVGLRDIMRVGLKGYLFAVLGSWAQKKLGGIVKVEPGADMKTAAKLAIKNKIQLALIDRDIALTLKEFSRRLTWRERFRFIGDIFRFTFFRKREMKRLGIANLDLTKVPEEKLIETLMKEMKTKYPNVYGVLVDDRNKIMARNLELLMRRKPSDKILAVVGAGHQKDILALVKKRYESTSI